MRDEADRDEMVEVIEAALAGALAAVRQLKSGTARVSRARRLSQTEIAIQILTDAGGPLPIDRIVALAAEKYRRTLHRDSLSSALAKKIRDGAPVVNRGRNIFEVTGLDPGGE